MKKLGELLKDAGVLDDSGLQRALAEQKKSGQRLGETLISLSLVTEDQIFDTLAKQLEIPIIAEAKLLLVEVQRPVLDLLPPALAWRLEVLPLLVDPARKQIAVVTSDPNDPRIVAGVKEATGIGAVKPYLAKRSALHKALTKWYGARPENESTEGELILSLEEGINDPPLSPQQPVPRPVTAQGARPLPAPIREVTRPSTEVSRPPPPGVPAKPAAPPAAGPAPTIPDTTAQSRAAKAGKQRVIRNVIVADNNKATANAVKRTLEVEGFVVEIATSPEEILNIVKAKSYDLVVVKGAIAENIGELERRVRAVFPMIEFRVVPSFGNALMGDPVPYNRMVEFTFDSMDLHLALIERGDATIRKRAQTNARYAKLVAQKLQLPRKTIDEAYFCAYLDVLGDVLIRQRGGDTGDRVTARRLALDLFKTINPPFDVETVLSSIEERVDGSGPRGMKGEAIPIGARILAVVLGYSDAKGMASDQVQKFLREMSGRLFDQRIVETFLQILRAESLLGAVGGTIEAAGNILIVDKDVAHTSTLELRLVNEGYKVSVTGDGQAALEMAKASLPSLIMSEIALPRLDGFNLCMTLKADPKTSAVPFVFVSGKNDEFNSNKALDLGADDFIGKPVNVEFLLKKLKQFLVKPKPAAAAGGGGGGVQGRLSDFGLIELIQTLALGMKTAKVEFTSDVHGTAALYMQEGRMVAASTLQKQGDEAFYEIATWGDGGFQILSGQSTKDKNVEVGNDFLILEALRRMDEAEAGISQEGKSASTVTAKK